MGIDFETAEEGAALLSTAIAELTEHAHEEAVVMRRGDLRIMVVRAETLKAAGADMITLAAALDVLARRGGALIL